MRIILTLLFIFQLSIAFAGNKTYDKLAIVNPCWKEQKDVIENQLPGWEHRSEREWIKLHLTLVEQILRSRATANLSASQQANRISALDHLHQYWQAGRFPINDQYNYRTPIFIDKYDNFCAVGYLVKASGHEEVSRMIAANTNLAYVRQMNYPELDAWAKENGFTKDELAWIQPGYGPEEGTAPLGKGVDSSVYELYADGDTLYVGGNFVNVDSTITANSISFVTENAGVYTWNAMDRGVNGPVYAITKFNNRIYIAGHFSMAGDSAVSNIAYWEGGMWHSSGCLFGEVRDLIVFNNSLYAAGHFDVCASLADINFARLSGNSWQQIPGLSGRINTMEVMDSVLLLGGAFTYNNEQMGAIKWSPSGFSKFTVGTKIQVNDFDVYDDTVYVVGQHPYHGDTSSVFLKMYGNVLHETYFRDSDYIFKTLVCKRYSMMVGGEFNLFFLAVGSLKWNCMNLTPDYQYGGAAYHGPAFAVMDTIHKMIYYKGDLIAGGSFIGGWFYNGSGSYLPILNGICKRTGERLPTAIPARTITNTLKIYPNPTTSSLTLENNFNATQCSIQDISGRKIYSSKLQAAAKQEIQLPQLAGGMYLLNIANSRGVTKIEKLVIK